MTRRPLCWLFAGLALAATAASAHDVQRHGAATIDGPADAYAFPLPDPGSYRLPAIKPAGGGRVLDEMGQPRELRTIVTGHVTVLAFIYTRCADICPMATARLAQLQALAAEDPDIAAHLKLASMSFDPEHDTPEAMAEFASLWRDAARPHPNWSFFTAKDREDLAPILKAYGQSVTRSHPQDPTGALGHILRVFLIDPSGTVRNIYSLDFLDPRLVLTDVRTLLMEGGS